MAHRKLATPWQPLATCWKVLPGQENDSIYHLHHEFHICVLRFWRRWPESRVHGGPVASKRGSSRKTGTGLHLHPWTLKESWEKKKGLTISIVLTVWDECKGKDRVWRASVSSSSIRTFTLTFLLGTASVETPMYRHYCTFINVYRPLQV